jgi:hypothetical protein
LKSKWEKERYVDLRTVRGRGIDRMVESGHLEVKGYYGKYWWGGVRK